MTSEVFEFEKNACMPCFAFNKDLSKLACSPNDERIIIYQMVKKNWEEKCILKDHGNRVYGLDWAPLSNKLASCGADRNAYVWTEISPDIWKPSLVLLRITRAAICIRWSPLENKFAVGTGNRLICICYYEESNDWWVSKHIKKPIRSSVLSVDWHPNNNLIASGSSDFGIRIHSAAIKEVDKKPTATLWGDKNAFGAILTEFSAQNGGWIHCVKFSPSGDQLCWVSHDSCISIADYKKSEGYIYVSKMSFLPFLTCSWLNDNLIVAAGHENKPYLFDYENGLIKMKKCIDDGNSNTKKDNEVNAMNKFKNMDKLAQSGNNKVTSTSVHQNTIKQISLLNDGRFASSALDTQIVIWNKQ